jgi:hypothetical protein
MATRTAVRKRNQGFSIDRLLNRYFSSMLTPQQMRQQARRETNVAVQDSMRQLRTTYQRERERDLREQYAQGAYAGLLRGFGSEGSAESNAVKEAYARAAGLSQAEGAGFIGPTIARQAADVGTGQGVSENLAGYTGDVSQITPGAPTGAQVPGTNEMVLSYLNSLPKGTFAAQAIAAAKGLGNVGAQAGSEFALREAQIGQDLRELRDQYTMNVRDLQAKRPGMLQEALGNLRESGRGDFATLINAMYLKNTMAGQEAELTGTYKGKLTPAERTRRTAAAATAAATAATAERNAISRMNAKTSRMRANIAQQKVLMDQYGTQGDMVKLQQHFRESAAKWVQNILAVDKKKGRPLNPPPSRQALINAIFRIYGRSLVGSYGLTQQQVALWAAQVVNAFPAKYWNPKTYTGGKTAGKGGGKAPDITSILGGG